MEDATALWIEAPRSVRLRREPLPPLGEEEVEIEALFSGISRGTERIVFEGKVPESEVERMRCPLQAGDFPAPVKYGYAAVGRVVSGSPELKGRPVFCLHPHQDRFAAPKDMIAALPDGVPPERAVLGANMETALNIVWDAGVLPGDRVAVVGAGVVGLLAARLAAKVPGTAVTLVDVDPAKQELAEGFGCRFAGPDERPQDCDVVIHSSGQPSGLDSALEMAGFEATVVEASWYGEKPVTVELGGPFHSRRLRLVSSQVGTVAAARRARRTHGQRLAQALGFLADPALDRLISGETAFSDIAGAYAGILADPATLCHRIRYR